MSKQLPVKVTSRKSGDEEWYEATVSVPGLKPTKLARKSDGNTHFSSRSAVTGAAKNLAKSLGFEDVDYGEATAAPAKKAAKKATKKAAAPATPASTTDTTTSS
jgi:hypothetical protein